MAITIAMYTALSLSWNFIGGFTGYPSFSTAAFFGLGCYAGALSQRAGRPMPCLPGRSRRCSSGLFAAALGGIILRLRGPLFRHRLVRRRGSVRLVISSWGSLTGGGDGLNVPFGGGRAERGRADLPCRDDRHHADRVRRHDPGRPQPVRLRPALHPAERGCRRHGRRQYDALQDHRLYAVGDVLRHGRSRLCLVDRLHRSGRIPSRSS